MNTTVKTLLNLSIKKDTTADSRQNYAAAQNLPTMTMDDTYCLVYNINNTWLRKKPETI
jgi:hypothetical protein